MALSTGARLGAYEIAEQIGAGGMGEVFRAVDTNLGRSVAIKVLPPTLSQDADRLARFEREAQTLAALNHPNIAQVYGFEKGGAPDSPRALVMELVEGPTLAERIGAGPMPLDEAIAIALQVAEALESAHDLGIVHRDLKPANIKVRADGTVKVLDFGLAKATAPADHSSAGTAHSPTITTPAMTQAGVVLGTAAYMSPEQAKGRVVDRRADIWAFGCVLYEMLTGTRAFDGDDISAVMVSVLRDEPNWDRLPPSTPARIRTLLDRCLQKDAKKRLPHIGVARFDLVEDRAAASADVVPQSLAHRVIGRVAWFLAGAAAVAAVAAVWPRSRTADPVAAIRFEIDPPPGGTFTGGNNVPRFAISPDGQSLVFQATIAGDPATDGESTRFWLRSFDGGEARPLTPSATGATATTGIQQPFWSPDGVHIAYFDERPHNLNRLNIQTGVVDVVCDVPGNEYGGTWNDDGVILLASAATDGILRVPASGGTPTAVTTVDKSRGERTHLFPEFLPDGRHFIYLSASAASSSSAIYAASLDGGVPKRIIESTSMAKFAPPSTMLYVRDASLFAQQLDLDRLELTGAATMIAASVSRGANGRIAVSASRQGVLVYATGRAANEFDAVWVDRTGKPLDASPLGIPLVGSAIRLSRDAKQLAFVGSRAGPLTDVWLYDTTRGVPTRLSTDRLASDSSPVFSPDGKQVLFRRSIGNGPYSLQLQATSGASPSESILSGKAGDVLVPQDWSADGQRIVYFSSVGNERGIWVIPVLGDRVPVPYLVGTTTQRTSLSLSPDGRWLAYNSDESGVRQVFVQSFPNPNIDKMPVSKPGGGYPRWRGDGREIFYIDASGSLVAAPIVTGQKLGIGTPVRLFDMPEFRGAVGYPYDVAPDGQRFIVVRPKNARSGKLTVRVNWLKSPDQPQRVTP